MQLKKVFTTVFALFLLVAIECLKPNAGICSDCDCIYPNQLEITVINVGQGDATLIATPSKIMLADVGESYWNSHSDAEKVHAVIQEKYGQECKCIDLILISHIHLDHIGYIQATEDNAGQILAENGLPIQDGQNLLNPKFFGGLAYLVKELGYKVDHSYFRDFLNHNPNVSPEDGGSKTFRNWRAYLLSPDGINSFNPEIVQLGSEIKLGDINGVPVLVDIVQVDGATLSNPEGCDPAVYFDGPTDVIRGLTSEMEMPPSENDLCIAFVLSYGDFQMFIGGDTSGENYISEFGYRYHDMETCLASDPILMNKYWEHLEVLRMNHHGSSHSSNELFVRVLNPIVAIFSVGDDNTYGHVDQEVLNRTLKTVIGGNSGKVFLTECGEMIQTAQDACDSRNAEWCASIVDDEYLDTPDTDEIGDANLNIVVGPDGASFQVQNYQFSSRPSLTAAKIEEAVASERLKWDIMNDNKIGLPEAIFSLRTISGLNAQ